VTLTYQFCNVSYHSFYAFLWTCRLLLPFTLPLPYVLWKCVSSNLCDVGSTCLLLISVSCLMFHFHSGLSPKESLTSKVLWWHFKSKLLNDARRRATALSSSGKMHVVLTDVVTLTLPLLSRTHSSISSLGISIYVTEQVGSSDKSSASCLRVYWFKSRMGQRLTSRRYLWFYVGGFSRMSE
jgi:hypothetical protein